MELEQAKRSNFLRILGITVLGTFISIAVATALVLLIPEEYSQSNSDSASPIGGESTYDFSGCNVVGIDIRGCLVTYAPTQGDASTYGCDAYTSSEEVLAILDAVRSDDAIQAVLLQIDSGGGLPVAGEEIARAVQETGKPSVAWIRSTGASAAYWAATGASTIVASENSDIGSIGVTMSYVDNVKNNEETGLRYNQLTTGKFKDLGSPDKSLTEEDRNLILRDLNLVRDSFIRAVSINRKMSVEQVTALADGSTVLGAQAKIVGLIDTVGGKPEAWVALKNTTGDAPVVCWPQY